MMGICLAYFLSHYGSAPSPVVYIKQDYSLEYIYVFLIDLTHIGLLLLMMSMHDMRQCLYIENMFPHGTFEAMARKDNKPSLV